MSAPPPPLPLSKCSTCHARFVPVDGPCPRCGAATVEPYAARPDGTVLAVTALEVPPPGWERPHGLALVEVEDAVRLLVIAGAPLPSPGSHVVVRADGAVYRVGPAEQVERGEGEVPTAGRARLSFEPPR